MTAGSVIFITGTDTDVGKTMVSLLAMHVLAGRDAVYLKPVQTGCLDPNHDSDPAFIHRHLPAGLPCAMTPADCIQACRLRPKAPLFAGEPVDPDQLTRFIRKRAAQHELVVVEGAGGLLVPITAGQTMLDLAASVQAKILVVARAGLGTINHSLLTLRPLKDTGLPCLGVVLVDPTESVPAEDRSENAMAITLFSGQPVHGVIGRIIDPARPCSSFLRIIASALEVHPDSQSRLPPGGH